MPMYTDVEVDEGIFFQSHNHDNKVYHISYFNKKGEMMTNEKIIKVKW